MNTDARVKVGDYFYYGLGTDDIGLIEDDSSEDLEELLNTEKALKKQAEKIMNNVLGKEDDSDKDSDKEEDKSETEKSAEKEDVNGATTDDEDKKKKKRTSIFDIVIYLKSKFYIGHGTVLYKKAVANYQVAVDLYSSIAMWNLGWMYENGVGVKTVSIFIIHFFFFFFFFFFFLVEEK